MWIKWEVWMPDEEKVEVRCMGGRVTGGKGVL